MNRSFHSLSGTNYLSVKEGLITAVSDSFLNITGYTSGEIIHKPVEEVFFHILKCRKDFHVLRMPNTHHECFIFTKALDVLEVFLDIYENSDTGCIELAYVFTPVSHLQFKDRFTYIDQICKYNVSMVAVYSIPDLYLLQASQTYLDMVAPPYNIAEKAFGHTVEEMAPEWQRIHVKNVWEYVVDLKKPYLLKEHLEGGRYWDTVITPIIENGKIKYGITHTIEVTDRVLALNKAEEQSKELEKLLLMKDEFLTLMSHEFKTPLTVINAAIQAMEQLYINDLTPKLKWFLSKIKQNALRQVRLVNNLLDIVRNNSGHIKMKMRDLDIVFLTKMITDSVSVFAAQKSVTIELESVFPEKIISVDEEKYERILLNLLSNAIKFSPKDKRIQVRLLHEPNLVKLRVSDEGVGIPLNKQELIFERFGQVDNSLTRQAEGTGLGLTLVKLFANAMDGSIAVESQEGKGSTFILTLPDVTNVLSSEKDINEFKNSHLVHEIATEFSDIYLE